jgi:hypothetical protein
MPEEDKRGGHLVKTKTGGHICQDRTREVGTMVYRTESGKVGKRWAP